MLPPAKKIVTSHGGHCKHVREVDIPGKEREVPMGMERRRKPRLDTPFPVTVRGMDTSEQAFEIHTVLENLSSGGLYLRLPRRLEPGAKLSAVVRLSTAADQEAPAPRVAVQGVVLRVEPKLDGGTGVAVRFTRHRFL